MLMDRLLLFALGITCITLVLLYLYIKNKFELYDNKIDVLFNVYQKLTNEMNDVINKNSVVKLNNQIIVSDDNVGYDSEDSCSVSDEETDESESVEYLSDNINYSIEPKIIVIKNEIDELPVINNVEVEEVEPELHVENNTETIKNVEMEVKEYHKMTVKELKQLIQEKNGPNLKTKSEMVQYLENN